LKSGEVAIHAKIEISTVGSDVSVAGVSEPTFGERSIEDDFRLQEGEVNLLGGLIQRTLTDLVAGVPGFGEIPGLRYLFSQSNKEVNDVEVLVMLTPRVVRLPDSPADQGTASILSREGSTSSPEFPNGLDFGQPSRAPGIPETLQGGRLNPPPTP
jgi:general secretion pathway protein D